MRDFDFAVGDTPPVSDDKVIGNSIFHTSLYPMVPIHTFDCSIARAAMVNHDVLPALWAYHPDSIQF